AFESELRLYEGDDPLDVWVRYIKWTKQKYPQGGRESNLSVLLERAVTRFTADEKYHNDARYVELWIEFFKQPLGPKQNSRLVIFDENKASELQEPKFEVWTAPPTARAKENEQKPEKWTGVKSRSGLSITVPPPEPSFQPLVEEDQPPAV
ncbi:hypothetical protein cypCar_00035935, partial [Cyprinus carpio]